MKARLLGLLALPLVMAECGPPSCEPPPAPVPPGPPPVTTAPPGTVPPGSEPPALPPGTLPAGAGLSSFCIRHEGGTYHPELGQWIGGSEYVDYLVFNMQSNAVGEDYQDITNVTWSFRLTTTSNPGPIGSGEWSQTFNLDDEGMDINEGQSFYASMRVDRWGSAYADGPPPMPPETDPMRAYWLSSKMGSNIDFSEGGGAAVSRYLQVHYDFARGVIGNDIEGDIFYTDDPTPEELQRGVLPFENRFESRGAFCPAET